MRWLGGLLLALLALPVAAAGLPASFEAHYEVEKAGILVGKANRSFHQAELRYHSNSRTAGLLAVFADEDIRETSWLALEQGLLRPLRYEKKRDGRTDELIQQEYDWSAKQLHMRINGKPKEQPLEKPVLDQAAFQLRLMQDLAAGKRDLDYTIASDSRLNEFKVRFLGEEKMKTRLGSYQVLVVRATDGKVITTLWCAPELEYVPVQIKHEEKGVSFTAHITRYKKL